VLGTATTNSSGNFTFSGAETACPAGQQAYIVAAGGHTGSNSANTAALLMTAIGPCASLTEGSSGTLVNINEPTTIAAAYALSGFMTVTGTTVNISAPANNNAATAACTVVSHATTACKASGLAHAFLNATNLVTTNYGVANFYSPANSTAVVPQALINTLANSVEACINSSGASSAACTTLFTNTGNPAMALNPLIVAPPADTLSALLDLALYPSMAQGCSTAPTTPCAAGTGTTPPTDGTTVGGTVPSAATTALFNLANGNAYYAPALTASPLDFTIAIAYPETGALWGSTSDINDNIYVYDNATAKAVFSLSSDGAAGWTTATGTAGGCGSYSYRCSVAADTLGNLWVVDSSGVTQLSTAGVLGTTIAPLTGSKLESGSVDVGNNLWLAVQSIGSETGASGIEELPQGGSAIVDINVGGVPEPYATKQPTFDSAGNLWVESDNTSGKGGPGVILMLNDGGSTSLTSPAFTNTGSGNGNPIDIPGGTATPGNGVMVDPAGNLWYSAQDDLLEVTSSGSESGGGQNYNIGAPAIVYGPTYEAGVERNAAMDGDGKIVIDATSTGAGYLAVYYPNALSDGYFTPSATVGDTGADVYLNPCYTAYDTTTCAALAGGQSTIVNNPRSTLIDASGAIWVPTQSAGYLIQVLGPGAPTWSQKSYIPLALAPNLAATTTTLRPY
jgi:hypothetical protein